VSPSPFSAAITGGFMPIQGCRQHPEARQALDTWWSELVIAADGRGLALLANRYATLDELFAREYAGSLRLDLDYLSPDE